MIDIVHDRGHTQRYLASFREYALNNRERCCAEAPLRESIELYYIEAGEEAPDTDAFYRIRNGLINTQLITHRSSSHGKSREVHLYALTERGRELADEGEKLRRTEQAVVSSPKQPEAPVLSQVPSVALPVSMPLPVPPHTSGNVAATPPTINERTTPQSSPEPITASTASVPAAVPDVTLDHPPAAEVQIPPAPKQPRVRSSRLAVVTAALAAPPTSPLTHTPPALVLLLMNEEARLTSLEEQHRLALQARDAARQRVSTVRLRVTNDPQLLRSYERAKEDLGVLVAELESAEG